MVFHIIHDNGPENITDAQVYDAIRVLNEDYNKQNPDWPNVQPAFLVPGCGYRHRVPAGANLIPKAMYERDTRTESEATYVGDWETTQLIHWPRDRYMNVWVAQCGWSCRLYLLSLGLDDKPEADGIVVLSTYLGSIGTSSFSSFARAQP